MLTPALFLACCMPIAVPDADAKEKEAVSPPPIHVVYFIPNDCEPIPGYQQRLGRVMHEVQRFYREGMKQNGYGEMTFALEQDDDGELLVHVVNGKEGKETYGRNSYGIIRREINEALAQRGVDNERRVTIFFTPLLLWNGDVATEHGPYVGGGSYLGGMCCAYDDPLLDPRHLGSNEKGGYYHRHCSIGEFNSHYIGGVAHELGHALGLPHVKEKASERHRGNALMGSGNHTYGRELRGNQTGTFLAANSAMLLSTCRAFAGDLENASHWRVACKLADVNAEFADGVLKLTGRIESELPAFGIAAYHDRKEVPADYDAVGWTCDVEEDGTFELQVGEFTPGERDLRLRVCHEGGPQSRFSYSYTVDAQRTPDLKAFQKN